MNRAGVLGQNTAKDDVTMVNTNLHGKVEEKETHFYDSHDKITDDVTMVNTNLHGKVEEKETLLR